MFDKDLYHVIHSPLSQDITRDDRTVRASIYDDGEGKWILEVEDEYGNSSVWDQHFDTDRDALNEAYRTIQEEGITSLIGKPSSTDEPKLRVGLSDEELDELSAFLMSEDTSDETMMLDTLDGFLTAIVSGPVTLLPSQWLPRVWGPSPNDEPAFETIDQAMHITGLIMRHMNGIIANLQWEDDQELQPIFDVASYPDDSNEYSDGEMWAHGYMTGVSLSRKEWAEFYKHPNGAEVLRPIYLLGDDNIQVEEEALTQTPAQREVLTELIPASAVWIYQFWQPYRQATVERFVASTYQREHPKVGRNDACPCGSGKKFKKCCGSSPTLH